MRPLSEQEILDASVIGQSFKIEETTALLQCAGNAIRSFHLDVEHCFGGVDADQCGLNNRFRGDLAVCMGSIMACGVSESAAGLADRSPDRGGNCRPADLVLMASPGSDPRSLSRASQPSACPAGKLLPIHRFTETPDRSKSCSDAIS